MAVIVSPSVTITVAQPQDACFSGAGLLIRYATVNSPFGVCFIAFCEQGICYLGFPSLVQEETLPVQLQKTWPKAVFCHDQPAVQTMAQAVFAPAAGSTVNLLVKGTPFQIETWQALLDIPRGATCSYADIARKIHRPKACRAAGSAVGKNPVSYLIPCHRVLPQGGGVGNYLWGSAIKQQILAAESGQQ